MPKAKHFKAAAYVHSQLFAGLTSFALLETRIAALPDEKDRGDAFEVFAEAYLATQRKHDAANVWPHDSVPLDILKNLGFTQQDQGVDGVLQTLLGQFDAYQVKFRTGRPALTWRELSTFIGLADSPHIHSRVLLTNCDELPAVLNDRQGFFCIRGADLDRMEADDFRAIEAWLADAAYTAPKKTPQPHQTEALNALLPALQTHDRVSAIMACGTGKTLVALWVMERLQARRVLVLLPSLALLRQTLHEWLRETSLPSLAYLCVCSDPTVKEGIDALNTQQSDLDFQVSTDAASVRSFLDAPFAGVKMIFSTYQSASVVGAAMRPGEAFDLAVFDEAHKTAGREGRNFALALDDKNLSIRKRLFLTATPRHYNPHDRDREGEAKLLFSMDNPEVYGPQAYRLTFAEAARRGIICRYKVLISVITSEEVTNELLQRGEVLIEGDLVQARMVANQIALRHAVDKFGTKRIFTFHRTVRDAREFVEGKSGVRNQLKDFHAYHVNGTMTAAQRERLMREFRNCANGLMSNARCLTEGVDVPAVDMVAFLSPRRSLVDIVQATGRAMRRAPGKEIGYVLVPLFVEMQKGESVEEAVGRTRFTEIWETLQTLQEQDDVLAEYISRMAETKGRTGEFNAAEAEMVEVQGENVGLDTLLNSVAARVFDDLFATWDVRYGELVEFTRKHGHCRVPNEYNLNKQLASWVLVQRQLRAKNRLPFERIAKLEALGFEWNPHDADWQQMLENLKAYKEKHGHTHVPTNYKPNPKLAAWVILQRVYYKKRALASDRIAKLEALGFNWAQYQTGNYTMPGKSSWVCHFEELEAYKVEHGNTRVSKVNPVNKQLGRWVHFQRAAYVKGNLLAERIAKLDSLGFEWVIYDKKESGQGTWHEQLTQLEAFKAGHGHCRVPQGYKPNKKLGAWVSDQRSSYARGKLSPERIGKLEALGFEWRRYQRSGSGMGGKTSWDVRLAELKVYKSEHGHCRVPRGYKPNKQFASWVKTQRQSYAKGKLSSERVAKLKALGFEWTSLHGSSTGRLAIWDERLAALEAYKSEHGHCRVPGAYKPNKRLGAWVKTQRQSHAKGKLPSERVAKLEALGFEWTLLHGSSTGRLAIWDERLAALEAYKSEHGHCRVPQGYKLNKQLGRWVNAQRLFYAKGKLSSERIAKLEALGFEWKLRIRIGRS